MCVFSLISNVENRDWPSLVGREKVKILNLARNRLDIGTCAQKKSYKLLISDIPQYSTFQDKIFKRKLVDFSSFRKVWTTLNFG